MGRHLCRIKKCTNSLQLTTSHDCKKPHYDSLALEWMVQWRRWVAFWKRSHRALSIWRIFSVIWSRQIWENHFGSKAKGVY